MYSVRVGLIFFLTIVILLVAYHQGPVLFVIFVNEICNLLPPNFSLKLFADDVKLYSTVISNSDAVDLGYRSFVRRVICPKCSRADSEI